MKCAKIISAGVLLHLFLAVAGAEAENLVALRLCPVSDLTLSEAAASLPTPLVDVPLGSTFFLEIWTKDISDPARGISGGFLNVVYSTGELDATGLNHGSTYTVLSSGTIDDPAGLVEDFGGNTLGGTPGKTEWARLGWITLSAAACGTATFTAGEASSGDGFARFQEDSVGGLVPWLQIDAPSASVTVIPEPGSLAMLAACLASVSLAFWRRRTTVSCRGLTPRGDGR
jgi:hypothetical protein